SDMNIKERCRKTVVENTHICQRSHARRHTVGEIRTSLDGIGIVRSIDNRDGRNIAPVVGLVREHLRHTVACSKSVRLLSLNCGGSPNALRRYDAGTGKSRILRMIHGWTEGKPFNRIVAIVV